MGAPADGPPALGDRFRHRLGLGAELEPDGHTRFRLWAPSAAGVELLLWHGPARDARAPDARRPMRPAGAGWFEDRAACGAGTRYRYRVTPADPQAAPLAVPDPSVVVDPSAYA